MACSVFKRILTLLNDPNIDIGIKKFYNFDILARLCTDLFHMLNHKCDLCNKESGKGLFHPHLPKFNKILNKAGAKVNLLVVEQLWRKWNKLHFLNLSTKVLFEVTLARFQIHVNKKIKDKLQSDGYTFVDLSQFNCLRYLHLPPFTISNQPTVCDLQAIQRLSFHKVSNLTCITFNRL